jgi:hypothetical protein
MPVLFYSFPCFLLITIPSSLPLCSGPACLPSPAAIYSAFCSRSSFLPRGLIFHRRRPRRRAGGKKATRVASARLGPGFEFNYSSPHYTRKGRKLHECNYFLPRALFPLPNLPSHFPPRPYRRLNTPMDRADLIASACNLLSSIDVLSDVSLSERRSGRSEKSRDARVSSAIYLDYSIQRRVPRYRIGRQTSLRKQFAEPRGNSAPN